MAMLFLAPAALAFAIGATQAVDELGASFSPAPTKAPSMELVKAKMGKRAATNICTEWTISGIGRPQCSSSQTCIFQTIDDYFYEGCGLADVNYDWITDCYNYPSTGATPSSELYCPKSAPYCGYLGFVFASGYTAYNFGCDTSSYQITAQLITDAFGASDPDTETMDTTSRASAATSRLSTTTASIPVTRSTSAAYIPTSMTSTPTSTRTAASSSSSSTNPTIGSHSVKVAIGLVVGVVVGGLVLIAVLLGTLIWCCIRKRRQKRLALTATGNMQQQEADTAFHNNQRIPEMGGKPLMGAYTPNVQEKPSAMVGATEVHGNTQPVHHNAQNKPTSPPPTYQGPSPMQSPMQGYNELATQISGPERPVSPMGATPSQTPVSEMYGSPHSRPGELMGDNRQSYPPPPPAQQYQAPTAELLGENRHTSPPSGVQEMGVGSRSPGTVSRNQPVAEMSATVGSRVSRRPVGAPSSQSQAVNMSGAPLKEGWTGHHELE